MTIYDAPVDDTVFFPVSGDMMRQMKHEEENGTGNPAKSSPDAADLNDYQEEQINMNDTAILPENTDTNSHPAWCDQGACIPPLSEDDDLTIHTLPIGSLHPRFSPHLGARISVDLVQPNDAEPRVLITNGDAELQVDELDRLLYLISRAQMRLIETGED